MVQDLLTRNGRLATRLSLRYDIAIKEWSPVVCERGTLFADQESVPTFTTMLKSAQLARDIGN